MLTDIQRLITSAVAAGGVDWSNPVVIAACITLIGAVVVSWFQKRFEKESINKAVLAEVRRLLEVMKIHKRYWDGWVERREMYHPLIPFSHSVYTKQVQNVGVLKRDLVADVVQFYGYVDFLNALQKSRKCYVSAGKSDDFNSIYGSSLENSIGRYESTFGKQFIKLKIPPYSEEA